VILIVKNAATQTQDFDQAGSKRSSIDLGFCCTLGFKTAQSGETAMSRVEIFLHLFSPIGENKCWNDADSGWRLPGLAGLGRARAGLLSGLWLEIPWGSRMQPARPAKIGTSGYS
jgi:hypothetical protein